MLPERCLTLPTVRTFSGEKAFFRNQKLRDLLAASITARELKAYLERQYLHSLILRNQGFARYLILARHSFNLSSSEQRLTAKCTQLLRKP